MTVTVPNRFFADPASGIVKAAEGLWVKRAYGAAGSFKVRNTLHGMLVVLEGSKRLRTAGGEIQLRAPEAALFAQGHYFVSENRPGYRALAIYFDDGWATAMLARYGLRAETDGESEVTLRRRLAPESPPLLLARSLWAMLPDPASVPALRLRTEALFADLFAAMPRTMGAFFATLTQDADGRFAKVIEENLDMIDSVDAMARLVRMSPAHFRRRFKARYGTSPRRWLEQKRLERAALLLAEGGLSVKEVAAACGFASVSWFIERFKKRYKTTPKRFGSETGHF